MYIILQNRIYYNVRLFEYVTKNKHILFPFREIRAPYLYAGNRGLHLPDGESLDL